MTDKELAEHIKGYKTHILNEVDGMVLAEFIDKPLPDFTEEENGFERGLMTARRIIQSLKDRMYSPRRPTE